jgi:hypothetical protein
MLNSQLPLGTARMNKQGVKHQQEEHGDTSCRRPH